MEKRGKIPLDKGEKGMVQWGKLEGVSVEHREEILFTP